MPLRETPAPGRGDAFAATALSLRDKIEAERVRILYSALPVSLIVHVLAVAVLAYGLRLVQPVRDIAVWVAVMLVIAALRIVLYRSYSQAMPPAGDALVWERRFALGGLAMALGWVALIVLLFPAYSFPHQMLVVFVTSAMAIGGSAAVQASGMAFIAFVMPLMLALIIRLGLQGDDIYQYAALLMLLTCPIIANLFFRLHRVIQESLAARFEKEALAEELEQAEATLKRSLAEEQVIFDVAMVGIAFIRERRITRCNHRMEEMFAFEPGELEGNSTRVLYRSDKAWHETVQRIDENMRASGMHDGEFEFCRRDGLPLWCRYVGRALDSRDLARGAVWIFADQTKRRKAEAELVRAHATLSDAVESIPDAFALFDKDDRLVLCNHKYVQISMGVDDPEQAIGKRFEELVRVRVVRDRAIPEEYAGDAEAWIAELVRRHLALEDMVYQVGDGRWLQMRERRTSEGGIVGVRSDVTDLKLSHERIEFLANHDPLTGLPNRRLLEDRMQQAIGLARRNKSQTAVMLLDLDEFKGVNDRHGHRCGDEVLKQVADRLRTCVRGVDTVSRFAGDEFVIVLSDLHQPDDVRRVVETVLASIGKPIQAEDEVLRVHASVGIAVYPNDGADPDMLLRHADAAMYRAKEGGRNGYRFYGGEGRQMGAA